MQEEVGLQSITDGEFRRGSWFFGFVAGGRGPDDQGLAVRFPRRRAAAQRRSRPPMSKDKLRRTRGITTDEFCLRQRHHRADAEGDDAGAEPGAFLPRRPDAVSRAAYPDIGRVLARPDRGLPRSWRRSAALGCTYVQLDEVPCAMLCDPRGARAASRRWASTPSSWSIRYICRRQQIADAAAGRHDASRCISAAATTRATGWPKAAMSRSREKLFSGRRSMRFSSNTTPPRAGGFEPLRHMPASKTVDPRPGQQQDAGARAARRAAAAHRRGEPLRPARPARRSARNAASPRSVGGNPLTHRRRARASSRAWSRWPELVWG